MENIAEVGIILKLNLKTNPLLGANITNLNFVFLLVCMNTRYNFRLQNNCTSIELSFPRESYLGCPLTPVFL